MRAPPCSATGRLLPSCAMGAGNGQPGRQMQPASLPLPARAASMSGVVTRKIKTPAAVVTYTLTRVGYTPTGFADPPGGSFTFSVAAKAGMAPSVSLSSTILSALQATYDAVLKRMTVRLQGSAVITTNTTGGPVRTPLHCARPLASCMGHWRWLNRSPL